MKRKREIEGWRVDGVIWETLLNCEALVIDVATAVNTNMEDSKDSEQATISSILVYNQLKRVSFHSPQPTHTYNTCEEYTAQKHRSPSNYPTTTTTTTTRRIPPLQPTTSSGTPKTSSSSSVKDNTNITQVVSPKSTSNGVNGSVSPRTTTTPGGNGTKDTRKDNTKTTPSQKDTPKATPNGPLADGSVKTYVPVDYTQTDSPKSPKGSSSHLPSTSAPKSPSTPQDNTNLNTGNKTTPEMNTKPQNTSTSSTTKKDSLEKTSNATPTSPLKSSKLIVNSIGTISPSLHNIVIAFLKVSEWKKETLMETVQSYANSAHVFCISGISEKDFHLVSDSLKTFEGQLDGQEATFCCTGCKREWSPEKHLILTLSNNQIFIYNKSQLKTFQSPGILFLQHSSTIKIPGWNWISQHIAISSSLQEKIHSNQDQTKHIISFFFK
eukprot:TRINITY_DN2424_c0_g1_i2.p1 TRINITY_DN2424_c0_g1~~TRINITY_DN2424_c0_g1_i2.p1  ORF type:complete len:438 (-),score=108.86 TRINITY_DN2424_c0_g1_i2:7-1320(-)